MSGPPSYYDRLGAYFSEEVDLLDELDRTNRSHAYMRRVSLETLTRTFTPPGPLLEFGFGTGTEAVHLARAGFRVVGVDPSPAMLERAREKASQAGFGPSCDLRSGSTADLAALVDEFGERSFGGAFATLGPLNCEPDLPSFARDLRRVLRPGSALVALVINRFCAWEVAAFIGRADFRKAFRRFATEWGPLAGSGGGAGAPLRVFTYSPRSFARAFAPAFSVEECFALPAIMPPPYASPLVDRLGHLGDVLEAAEGRLAGRWPFPWVGDHFEVVLRARP
jgi:ubiquinone/menaquinone biosynthesis C-methylase UbiE